MAEQAGAMGNVITPSLVMSARRRWAVTAGVMTGMFLAALEATVVGTAMPTVISSLGGLNHYSWVFSAYLITSTVTVPVWGKLSDLYGRRLLYQIGIAVFLPRAGYGTTEPLNEEECSAETGERMVMAELTMIDPENEPVATRGD